MTTLKKVLLVIVPTSLVAGAFIFWYLKSKKPKPVYVSNSNPASIPPKKVSPSAGSGVFPLQSGSKNSTVKQLQTILGVTADGIFGPQTLAALQNQFGVSSVPDQNTLDIMTKGSGSGGNALREKANSLYNQFLSGDFIIKAAKDYFVDEVTEDSYGHLSPTGMGFSMDAGDTFDNANYVLDGVTVLGLLILKVQNGSLQGEYTIDPDAIILTTKEFIPYTDPNSGLTVLPGL